jgi:hypothetical protein
MRAVQRCAYACHTVRKPIMRCVCLSFRAQRPEASVLISVKIPRCARNDMWRESRNDAWRARNDRATLCVTGDSPDSSFNGIQVGGYAMKSQQPTRVTSIDIIESTDVSPKTIRPAYNQ